LIFIYIITQHQGLKLRRQYYTFARRRDSIFAGHWSFGQACAILDIGAGSLAGLAQGRILQENQITRVAFRQVNCQAGPHQLVSRSNARLD
jgi:hypothetical protein